MLTRRAATFDRVPAPQPGRCILAAPRSGRPNNYSRVQSSLRYGERFPRAGALSAGSPINLMHHSGSGFGPWWFFFFFFSLFLDFSFIKRRSWSSPILFLEETHSRVSYPAFSVPLHFPRFVEPASKKPILRSSNIAP